MILVAGVGEVDVSKWSLERPVATVCCVLPTGFLTQGPTVTPMC